MPFFYIVILFYLPYPSSRSTINQQESFSVKFARPLFIFLVFLKMDDLCKAVCRSAEAPTHGVGNQSSGIAANMELQDL